MKLELKAVKEQFVKLLKNFNNFEENQVPTAKPTTTNIQSSPSKALSSARARVRALYDARKNRMQARRAAAAMSSSIKTPTRSWNHDNEDKENLEPLRQHYRKHETKGSVRTQNTRQNKAPYKQKLGPHQVTCSGVPLTPIREERGLRHLLQGCASPCVSKMVGSNTFYESDGEYVTLKTPLKTVGGSKLGFSTPLTPTALDSLSRNTPHRLNDTSVWMHAEDDIHNRSADNTVELSSHDYSSSPDRLESGNSGVKYASSNVISELYTSPQNKQSLKDVSHITRTSRGSLREQPSAVNLSGAFSSTFNYPLHSTLNYPLHSTLNHDDFMIPRCDNQSNFVDSESEDSPPRVAVRSARPAVIGRQASPNGEGPIYINKRDVSSTSHVHHPAPPKHEILCSEHGIHASLGGPCIFGNDDEAITESSTDQEEVIQTNIRPRPSQSRRRKPRQRRSSRNAVTDTDCDSSYLSECHENDIPERLEEQYENVTVEYDSRQGCMRYSTMRRQTANTNLQTEEFKAPIGLSESDFLFDVTQKHLSLEATRSSIPAVSDLSDMMSEYRSESDDMSDSTLHASKLNESSDNMLDRQRNVTMRYPGDGEGARPCSLATTSSATSTGDSPSSSSGNGYIGRQAPVNSPNITDSGSSRPTTDTYDYVELPVRHLSKEALLRHQLQYSMKHSPARTHRRRRHTSSKYMATYASSGSRCSSIRESSLHSAGRYSRRSHRYEHDSGLSVSSYRRYRNKSRDHLSDSQSSKHFYISDNEGHKRAVIKHSAVANLEPQRKRAIAKGLKQFKNTSHLSTGTSSSIHVLGQF